MGRGECFVVMQTIIFLLSLVLFIGKEFAVHRPEAQVLMFLLNPAV